MSPAKLALVALCATVAVGFLLFSLYSFAYKAGSAEGAIEASVHLPRLVGYGCDGAAGPLYAEEEDHLPFCNSIESAEGAMETQP